MRGNSNENIARKRAGGWCESVCDTCESILEQGTEHSYMRVSKYFRLFR
jgi:hypothetical protein